MPLCLKTLELHGFKTFAAKHNFEFAEGITAIVGPNGSGKSNIADALRWVLGEQSYSLLRAKKTEDMIFAGSEQRPRAGMASATITFDNSDNWLPVDFSEVAVSRRAYRDGRNDYLLNGQHVRLKDINELLAQSGLSERTYTILGQGLVDASLALKADERRKLFEEAAGIGLYRSRREETLRRLDVTRRNLDRVLDILAELEPRLRSLERQAARAQEYSQVQADLRVLLREWYGYHWHRSQHELAEAMDAAHLQEARLSEAREAYQAIRRQFADFREHLNGLRARLNSWHRQSAQLHASRESTSTEMAVLEERLRSLSEQRLQVLSESARLEEEIRISNGRLDETRQETGRFQAEFEEAQLQARNAQQALDASQEQRNRLEKELDEHRLKNDTLAARKASLAGRLEELGSRSESIKIKLVEEGRSIQVAEAELTRNEEEHLKSLGLLKQAEEAVRNTQKELGEARQRKTDLEDLIKEMEASRAEVMAGLARFQAQMVILDQAEQALSGYAEGTKYLLEAARRSELGGTLGALSNALEVPADLENAISAVLGEYTDAVLLQSGSYAGQALDLLDAVQSSRASLLPLDWLTPGGVLQVDQEEGVLGVAAELVRCPPTLRPAVDLLLGQVIIIRDRSLARKVLTEQPRSVRVVTLKGEVFHASGQVLAGKPTQAAALARPRQRRELQETIARSRKQLDKVDSELQKLTGHLEIILDGVRVSEARALQAGLHLEETRKDDQEASLRLEAASRQVTWLKNNREAFALENGELEKERQAVLASSSQVEEEFTRAQETLRQKTSELVNFDQDDLQEQVTHWTARLAVLQQSLSDARQRQGERLESLKRLEGRNTGSRKILTDLETSVAGCEVERAGLLEKAADFNHQLEELRTLIEPAEKELEKIEQQEDNLQREETENQAAMGRVERLNNQFQLELGRKQEALETLRGRIEDDFGLVMFDYAADVSGPVPLPLDGMVEQLPIVTSLASDLEENLMRQRAQLRRMGAVNPEAQQEYLSVKERHAFLKTQMEDLNKAEADLHKIIAELDDMTRKEFQKTFDLVADQFHAIFHRLFGGGSATLLLTDPENLTETGIDIEARLPGRREQGLSLLSGGERSLTAIALVFALLKVSPTPVCVMDEVDAMLDEANVGRFRDLLAELSKDTQFIIITHNRNTVQAADVLYGVTMGRDSTSQVISLRLDQVSDEYLK